MFFKKKKGIDMNLFDKIVNADDLIYEDVYIKEWDIKARMYSLTSIEKITAAEGLTGENLSLVDKAKIQYKLIAMSLRDQDGERIIPIDKSGILEDKNSEVVTRLVEVWNKVNLSEEPEAEDIEKN